MHLLGIVCIIYVIYRLIKEACTPTLTAEHWANKELQHKDRMNGMSEKDILKNAERGRYYIPKEVALAYPAVHRDPENNKPNIENCRLYHEDLDKYGAVDTMKWVKQGKYNLNPDELKIEEMRLEKHFAELIGLSSNMTPEKKKRVEEIGRILETSDFDYKNTDAVRQWQSARNAELQYRQSKERS